jgi:cereblon
VRLLNVTLGSKSCEEISYEVSAKLSLDAGQRELLHSCPHTASRLRLLLQFACSLGILRCATCKAPWGVAAATLCLSDDCAFVNRYGVNHSLVTIARLEPADALLVVSDPTAEDSWYAGYEWSIAICHECRQHAGWRFSRKHDATTEIFWGLRCDAMVRKDDEEEGWQPRRQVFTYWPEADV